MGSHESINVGKNQLNSNSLILKMKPVLYAAVIIAVFASSAKAATKCWSCMKVDEATNTSRPWKCGQDGATMLEETCGERVIGCVSEHVKHRSGGGEWDEFRMKHRLDPARPRPRELVEAVLASGQDPRDMAKSDTIMVSGCMEYYTVEDGSGNADNEIDICFCDGDLCNEKNCVCTAGKDSGGSSLAAFSALTAVAAAAAKHLA